MKAAQRYSDLFEGRMVKTDWTCQRLVSDDAGHVHWHSASSNIFRDCDTLSRRWGRKLIV